MEATLARDRVTAPHPRWVDAPDAFASRRGAVGQSGAAMSAPDVVAGRVRAPRLPGRERLLYPLAVLLLAAAYYGAAELVFWLEVGGPVAAVVWLPAGVGIAALYLGGNRLWPGVLLGDLLANDYGVLPVGTALAQTCGNLAEILIAATLLRRLARKGPPLASIGGVMGTLGALAAGVTVSATIGTLAQLAGDVIDSDELATVWRTWWLGDFTGAIVLVPLAMAWSHPPRIAFRERGIEGGALLVALVAVSAVATSTSDPLLYLLFPPLIWAALRFGTHGATLAVAVVAGFTVWNTSNFAGPFVFSEVNADVVGTQLFIAVAAVTAFCLAAVVAEREAFGDGLRASRARLVEASDTVAALPSSRVDDTAEAPAYYVIAEAITNSHRYSQATAIEISAVVRPHRLDIVVADDGVGGATEVMSSGLQGLRDRVEAIGGSFELESPRGQGTRVEAIIPAMALSGRAP
jgi:integral membrane sensor domain MASE1